MLCRESKIVQGLFYMIDFSGLSDDQLLQLIQSAFKEAIARGASVRAAAEAEVVSAQEKAAIEFKVAERFRLEKEEKERERIAKEAEERLKKQEQEKNAKTVASNWAVKAAAIAAIRQWGYEDKFSLAIWSRGADRRVYFKSSNADWEWCLYLTGNQYNPPGNLAGHGKKCWFDDKQDELKRFLEAVSTSWTGDASIPCDVGNIEPNPKSLKKYLQAIGIE